MSNIHSNRSLPASLDLLCGFEATARHLSFTLAAEELFLTQSAISRQVQTLEDQLGTKLFERRRRGIALTPAGSEYYRDVVKALALLRKATINIRARADRIVRVTTSVTFSSLWLVPRLTSFQSQNAGIAVHLHTENAIYDLDREGIDVAVRYTTIEKAGAGALRLFDETVVPVCSASLLGAPGKIPAAADLAALPLLHFADSRAARPWLSWEAWFEAMNLDMPRHPSSLTFTQYDQVIQAAIAGQGVALGRFPVSNDVVEAGLLVALTDAPIAAQGRGYWLLVSVAARERSEVTAFVDWLKQAVNDATKESTIMYQTRDREAPNRIPTG